MSYRRYTRAPCVSVTWGDSISLHTPHVLAAMSGGRGWLVALSACGHVCASHHDTHMGAHEGSVACNSDGTRRTGASSFLAERARNACGASGNHRTPTQHLTMPLGFHLEPTYRGATYLRHQTNRVPWELATRLAIGCPQAHRSLRVWRSSTISCSRTTPSGAADHPGARGVRSARRPVAAAHKAAADSAICVVYVLARL